MGEKKPRPWLHELKCEPLEFEATRKGRKPFELRDDDRDIQAGDYVLLREFDEGAYSGRTCMTTVTFALRHGDRFGEKLAAGVVCLGVYPHRQPRSI